MSRNAVVTGAGSGVGQAIAIGLAREGWQVVIVGRRSETLEETRKIAGELSVRLISVLCDVGDELQVTETGKRILSRVADVEVLVNAAGLHVPGAPMGELFIDDLEKLRQLLFFEPHGAAADFVMPSSIEDERRIVPWLRAREATARVGQCYRARRAREQALLPSG